MDALPIVLIVGVLVANIIATRLVLRDDLLERGQRVFQLLVVWLVPILGAIGVFAIHRSHEQAPGGYRNPPDPGEDFRDPARSASNRARSETDMND
jgi:hypothetical protein